MLATVKNSAVNTVFPIYVSKTSQFMFPNYLMDYQNVKIVKTKFKSEKSNKVKHKIIVVLTKKKRHYNIYDVCYMTFIYLFTYFMHMYL